MNEKREEAEPQQVLEVKNTDNQRTQVRENSDSVDFSAENPFAGKQKKIEPLNEQINLKEFFNDLRNLNIKMQKCSNIKEKRGLLIEFVINVMSGNV